MTLVAKSHAGWSYLEFARICNWLPSSSKLCEKHRDQKTKLLLFTVRCLLYTPSSVHNCIIRKTRCLLNATWLGTQEFCPSMPLLLVTLPQSMCRVPCCNKASGVTPPTILWSCGSTRFQWNKRKSPNSRYLWIWLKPASLPKATSWFSQSNVNFHLWCQMLKLPIRKLPE